MFRFLRGLLTRRIVRRHSVAKDLWDNTMSSSPMLRSLTSGEKDRLKDLVAMFLHQKILLPARDLVLTPRMGAVIAAQACLPILNLGLDWYRGWTTVIVYPGQFLRPCRAVDSNGVMHEWTEVLRGESWDRGPVVLSWDDIADSGPPDGCNVVVHEMAHKLDMLNGDADGFPPLHRAMRARDWTRYFTETFQDLNEALKRGENPPVDGYAAVSPAECFAVLSECFFELPELVRSSYPDIYTLLTEFYRQDPASRSRFEAG